MLRIAACPSWIIFTREVDRVRIHNSRGVCNEILVSELVSLDFSSEIPSVGFMSELLSFDLAVSGANVCEISPPLPFAIFSGGSVEAIEAIEAIEAVEAVEAGEAVKVLVEIPNVFLYG